MEEFTIRPIAHIETDFPNKFGIPRQAGIVEELKGKIVFEPEYRDESALRGLEEFTHIWVIWQFSENIHAEWSPTVRPPRLGGNVRKGVFATRSPFRPNFLGLSCLRLTGISHEEGRGAVLNVAGADMMNGTPIFDIKPYIPYSDIKTEASGGFAHSSEEKLAVEYAPGVKEKVSPDRADEIRGILREDPRPRYHTDPEREYALEYAGMEIKFTVRDGTLTVTQIN